jgi:hypothetical protein
MEQESHISAHRERSVDYAPNEGWTMIDRT